MPAITHTKLYNDIEPLSDGILVVDMDRGAKVTTGGIIIPDDDGKLRGIHPRWAKVYKVGKNVVDVKPGEYILVEHGMWTYGIEMILEDGEKLYLQKVKPESIMLVSEEKPSYKDVQKGKE